MYRRIKIYSLKSISTGWPEQTADNELGNICPNKTDEVLKWDPPTRENYSQECKTELERPGNHLKTVLLNALAPNDHNYPAIRGFFHVTVDVTKWYTAKRGDTIFETQLQKMMKSGLLHKASLLIRFGLLNDGGDPRRSKCVKKEIENHVRTLTNGTSSIEIQYFNPLNYECDSVRTLKNWCIDNKDALTFYLHNKGMTLVEAGIGYHYVSQWRAYMMFYLFERWMLCANSLMNGAKACGVNRRSWPVHHYSGNFW